ncbi:hypothetical protein AA0472_0769 [Acetobacter estunensis NRIC 0472]|uniref:Uncharacterized protein n=1 Tax=Acetobacter estunensis TaxID=104097 RepID=A0A967B9E2_9PROT|nr:hypothetical protein [Acetobacter estunensis]NHO55318.1 hypothetical protein [Acetobacter estunensis]GBQ22435.1 hypothetical protein AA0472_0769 [Acetobacter estunensis NRIC 0472]
MSMEKRLIGSGVTDEVGQFPNAIPDACGDKPSGRTGQGLVILLLMVVQVVGEMNATATQCSPDNHSFHLKPDFQPVDPAGVFPYLGQEFFYLPVCVEMPGFSGTDGTLDKSATRFGHGFAEPCEFKHVIRLGFARWLLPWN